MFSTIQDTVLQLIPGHRRRSATGWISFNAPCCQYRGHKKDSRGRGGIIINADGTISYHCFNCGYKTGYRPGLHLSYKFRKLLSWLGADENVIRRLVIDAIRVRELAPTAVEEQPKPTVSFKARSLPPDVKLIEQDPIALEYCQQRCIDLGKYPLLVSDRTEHMMNRRVIIPFMWQDQLIGYTARAWDPSVKPKYYSQYEPHYVYNIDRQHANSEFVVVCEGPFDAMSVDGVAILSNECSEEQADIIDSLRREVIVVPDRDRAGSKLINNALEYHWSVSFPVWQETCKDINEACVRYGRLFVLYSILQARETSRLKIELKRKRLYN